MKKTLSVCAAVLAVVAFVSFPSLAAETKGPLEPIATVGTFLDDAGITAEIKTRLAAEKGLSSTGISVTTTNSVVRLDGTVPSRSESALAETVARNLSNVKGVENNLKIRP